LHEGSRSTRIERSGATLIGVINDVTFDFSFEASDVATLWLSVGADRVISARGIRCVRSTGCAMPSSTASRWLHRWCCRTTCCATRPTSCRASPAGLGLFLFRRLGPRR